MFHLHPNLVLSPFCFTIRFALHLHLCLSSWKICFFKLPGITEILTFFSFVTFPHNLFLPLFETHFNFSGPLSPYFVTLCSFSTHSISVLLYIRFRTRSTFLAHLHCFPTICKSFLYVPCHR